MQSKTYQWVRALTLTYSALVLTMLPGLAKAEDKPIAWGLVSGAKHCVIFKESRKLSGGFFVVVATLKSVGKLTVVETDGLQFDPPTYIEDQPTMDALQTRAMHERLRYVKIPEHYSPELLQAARDMCGIRNLIEDGTASSSDGSADQSQ